MIEEESLINRFIYIYFLLKGIQNKLTSSIDVQQQQQHRWSASLSSGLQGTFWDLPKGRKMMIGMLSQSNVSMQFCYWFILIDTVIHSTFWWSQKRSCWFVSNIEFSNLSIKLIQLRAEWWVRENIDGNNHRKFSYQYNGHSFCSMLSMLNRIHFILSYHSAKYGSTKKYLLSIRMMGIL